jgi:hypothetical protein
MTHKDAEEKEKCGLLWIKVQFFSDFSTNVKIRGTIRIQIQIWMIGIKMQNRIRIWIVIKMMPIHDTDYELTHYQANSILRR